MVLHVGHMISSVGSNFVDAHAFSFALFNCAAAAAAAAANAAAVAARASAAPSVIKASVVWNSSPQGAQ